MKEIKLTQNMVALVDDEDFDKLSKYNWVILKSRTTGKFYARHPFWNKKTLHPDSVSMHRMLMGKSNLEIDHINGNGLDNRRCNLRLVTKAQNTYNAVKHPNCTSKYKGVYWRKERNCWVAIAKIDGKQRKFGSFKNEIEAASAYDTAAVEHFGEYARFNFPVSLLAVALKERTVP